MLILKHNSSMEIKAARESKMSKRRNSIPLQFKKAVIELYENGKNEDGEDFTLSEAIGKVCEDTGEQLRKSWMEHPHSTLYQWRQSILKAGQKKTASKFSVIEVDGRDDQLLINGVLFQKAAVIVTPVEVAPAATTPEATAASKVEPAKVEAPKAAAKVDDKTPKATNRAARRAAASKKADSKSVTI